MIILHLLPSCLFDETDSTYDKFLVNGPVKSLEDIEHGMDGTIKHFVTYQNSSERVCDYIEDRYGNRTNLLYTQQTVGGQTVNLLQSVTDPSGRQILYTWANLGTSGQSLRTRMGPPGASRWRKDRRTRLVTATTPT